MHSSKAKSPIFFAAGSSIEAKLEHSANAHLQTVSAAGRAIEVSFLQYRKALSLILLAAGSSIEAKLEHPLNAYSPIVSATGRVIEVNSVHSSKA